MGYLLSTVQYGQINISKFYQIKAACCAAAFSPTVPILKNRLKIQMKNGQHLSLLSQIDLFHVHQMCTPNVYTHFVLFRSALFQLPSEVTLRP